MSFFTLRFQIMGDCFDPYYGPICAITIDPVAGS